MVVGLPSRPIKWLGSWWSSGRFRFGGLVKRWVFNFDRNFYWDKRYVPGEPLPLWQRSSAGKELHSTGAEYLKDRFRIVVLDVTAGRYRVMRSELQKIILPSFAVFWVFIQTAHRLAVKWCHEQSWTYSFRQRPKMNECRSTTIYAIVDRPMSVS